MNPVVHVYTRKQAIADGVLIDVSTLAKELGFKVPVAVTAGVWATCVKVPIAVECWQDETGRLWDVLNMFRLKAKEVSGSRLEFKTLVQNAEGAGPEPVLLVGHCGPGDDDEPTITIMLPGDY